MSHRTIYEDIRSVISLLESASGPMRFVKRDGPTTAPSGPDHALASLSAAQASEKGLLTSGTFGHTGSTSSRSAALATSLENRLRQKTDGLGSTLYKLTWKHWDLPSGRQICALRASVRRTSGKDSGSMGPWPTPMACDARGSAGRGKKELPNIAQLSGWPTPVTTTQGARSDGARATGRAKHAGRRQHSADGGLHRWRDDRQQSNGRAKRWRGSGTTGRSKRSLAKQAAVLSGWPTRHERHGRDEERRTTGCDAGDRTQGSTARPTGERSNNTAYPTNGFWRDADWLGCRDGKFRPVEPGTSPLVNGAAARVGRLRGYGNAIVAQVAQTFIEATQGW